MVVNRSVAIYAFTHMYVDIAFSKEQLQFYDYEIIKTLWFWQNELCEAKKWKTYFLICDSFIVLCSIRAL